MHMHVNIYMYMYIYIYINYGPHVQQRKIRPGK